jgi:hypothetical protein
VTCLTLGFLAFFATLLPQARPAILPVCACLLPLMALALVASALLAGAGEGDIPLLPLLAGWVAVVGGAACDIYATVTHSPDLSREANPLIRALLDNGVSLGRVYVYAAVMQVLFVGMTMVLWLGMLKHRHTLAGTMPRRGSLLVYFKAGTGGRELSYRQWCCPLTWSELPWAYHFAWWTGVGFVGLSTYRFYLALEWYGVAPTHSLGLRLIAPSVTLVLTCWLYALWLRGARARLGSEEVLTDSPS